MMSGEGKEIKNGDEHTMSQNGEDEGRGKIFGERVAHKKHK